MVDFNPREASASREGFPPRRKPLAGRMEQELLRVSRIASPPCAGRLAHLGKGSCPVSGADFRHRARHPTIDRKRLQLFEAEEEYAIGHFFAHAFERTI